MLAGQADRTLTEPDSKEPRLVLNQTLADAHNSPDEGEGGEPELRVKPLQTEDRVLVSGRTA